MVFAGIREWETWLPSRCAICHAWPSSAVCDGCVGLFAQPRPRCRTCAISLPAPLTQCGACLRDRSPLTSVTAAVDYAYPWANLVRDFKFHADIAWARSFARIMRSAPWVDPAIDAADWIVPMPLSAQRLRERGFNQSSLLARALRPTQSGSVREDILVRMVDTAAQSSLPHRERQANVAKAFAVDPAQFGSLRGKKLLIVDDVMTTGASLHAAARALAHAGAADLAAVVFARTP